MITSRWSGHFQQAYDCLKAELSFTQVLRIATIKTPFRLHSDASGRAVGATLGQLDEQDVDQPLAFARQELRDT